MKLKFSLHGQALKRADRNYIVADSKNFLTAEFEFSHQWNSCEKTAIFKNEYGAYSVLLSKDKCIVPYEVMGGNFGVSVFGVSNELRITTNEIVVELTPSGYTEGETPPEPTPTVYEQLLTQIAQSEEAKADKAEVNSIATSVNGCSTRLDTIESLKADKTEVEELQTQADNNSSDITSLQTQMGDIGTALDNIIAIQNQYIGGDAQ